MGIKLCDIDYINSEFKKVSLSINTGEIIGMIGDNSLLYSLLDSLKNNIKIGFQKINEDDLSKTIYSFLKNNLQQFSNYKNLDKRINDSLKMVGLDETYLKRKLSALSYSERKKVIIASTLSYNPKILLLDEPSLGLDCQSKNHLIKLLKRLKFKYNKTIIIFTNDSEFLYKLADKVVITSKNKIIASGNKYDIFTNMKLLVECDIDAPKLVEFSLLVKYKKDINLGFRDDINDLMKDIYRYTE